MNFKKFPLDNQACTIGIGSFGYTSSEIEYSWTKNPVEVEEFALADYVLMDYSVSKKNMTSKIGEQSIIFLHFQFSRTIGYYFLRTYFPLTIIVMCSWVSFWLVKTKSGGEIVARVGLGITCCLAVVTIGFIGDTKLKVPYATALDVYMIICFAFVFLALAEYAFIHFVELYVRRIKFKDQDRSVHLEEMTKSLVMPIMQDLQIKAKLPGTEPPKNEYFTKKDRKSYVVANLKRRSAILKEVSHETCEIHTDIYESESQSIETDIQYVESTEIRTAKSIEWVTLYSSCESISLQQEFDEYEANESVWCALSNLLLSCLDCLIHTLPRDYLQKTELYYDTTAAVNKFDRHCRVVFPSTFLMINTFYWTFYLLMI